MKIITAMHRDGYLTKNRAVRTHHFLKVYIHRGWYSYQKAEAEVGLNKLNCIFGEMGM